MVDVIYKFVALDIGSYGKEATMFNKVAFGKKISNSHNFFLMKHMNRFVCRNA